MRKMVAAGGLAALLALGQQANAASDEQKQFAFSVVERNAEPMAQIGDSLFYFGELGMQEVESTKLMKETLEAAGFTVELGGAGMPTNLWAKWGSGRPAIAIVSEIDALPGGSQKPMELDAPPAGSRRARPHGGPQHPWRPDRRRRLRGQGGDAALQHPGHAWRSRSGPPRSS